ncbi:malto-oligosyltrehalose trehalohydrolase [Mycoplana dimorpha]|uniref:Malto-oligosyltrehalose trehalohydrolase n=1 Tax=Mycoplana dimorpha TaxID=28320 RepID=A0A2T5B5A1_MYCDI|nr:malto-oligosyltrehalose trehalohydrolase [Mycoplana dimorpha]PTM94168.1 maltooligosyl trehalose hydrolase [Mycoplana dimorpha]
MRPRHRHWGANCLGDDRVQFRLWAPSQSAVALALNGRELLMEAVPGGWFETTVDNVPHGTPYLFRLADGMLVPDPASCAQLNEVDGPSLVVDQERYRWHDGGWRGRPWCETVLYELHVGTFTPEGSFRAAIDKLEFLSGLGVTAIELMPVAQFPGRRGWGYDGVLHYAPHNAYGTADDLKALVDAAHALGIMVLLDVVYNHFGPQGNYLGSYAPSFFHPERHTPWGGAIAFDEPAVRRYFIDNALYWIGDFHFDGLRLDATEHMEDSSDRHILEELAGEVRSAFPDREVHLICEDPAHLELLQPDETGRPPYTAVWNHDLHHVLHVIATDEQVGHYAPFAVDRWASLREAITGRILRLSTSGDISYAGPVPPRLQVTFLQNHDQVGNRAFGERLASLADDRLLAALMAMLLLSPQVPMLFMGEEFGEGGSFHFFLDHDAAEPEAMRRSRWQEAQNFSKIAADVSRFDLPDPRALETFERSKLDWPLAADPAASAHAGFVRDLVALRRKHVVPFLSRPETIAATALETAPGVLAIDWSAGEAALRLRANLLDTEEPAPPAPGQTIFATAGVLPATVTLPPFAVLVTIDAGAGTFPNPGRLSRQREERKP